MNIKNFLITLFIKQNKWHRYSVLGHTVAVICEVIKAKDYKFIIPALLHDIGKPFVAYQDESDKLTGEYSFTDHEEKSYQIIKNWPISDWTKQIVRYHYLIRDIHKCREKKKLVRYHAKSLIWSSLSDEVKKEIEQFMKYDDLGKK